MTHYDIERYYFGCFFVYPQILDPGEVQRTLSTVYVVVKEVEVEMEVVVIQ